MEKPDVPADASKPSELRQAAPLESVEARYRDLLQRLGVQGHDGAVSEIERLRASHFSGSGESARWRSACEEIALDLRNHDLVRLGASKCIDRALRSNSAPG